MDARPHFPGRGSRHFRTTRQRMLAQLVSHSGGTPQVLSSTPRGSEFQAEGKKIPSLALCAKALVVSRAQVGLRTLTWPRQVVPRGYVSQCQGGVRVREFSRSGNPRLLLKLIPVGWSFPTRPSFFRYRGGGQAARRERGGQKWTEK